MKISQVLQFCDTEVKVYFQDRDSRYPMIGKILFLKDGKDLADKGMVRFIKKDYLENWDGFSLNFTRIFVVSDFKIIETKNQVQL